MLFKADTKQLLYICTKDITVPEWENIYTFISRNTQHVGKAFKQTCKNFLLPTRHVAIGKWRLNTTLLTFHLQVT
jgi:hypothetical protein